MKEVNARRHLEHERKKIAKAFETEEKRKKVESMKRQRTYKKQIMMQKIQRETDRTLNLKEEKARLQEERKQANMQASFQKQRLVEAMEKMKTSKGWSQIAGGGDISLASLEAAAFGK